VIKRSIPYIVLVVLLSACDSIRYVSIDTYKPAEIIFPGNVSTVLIVNNAVPQPSDTGYEYSLFGVKQDTARASADSALFDACRSLGEAIMETDYFNDVLLLHEPLRKDNNFLHDERLSKDEIDALYNETGADAIISIDRLLFHMNKEVLAFKEGYLGGYVKVKVNGIMRAYAPGRETALATVIVSDSIDWFEYAYSLEAMKDVIVSPDAALRLAGEYIGGLSSPNFVPYWQRETRWYYTDSSSDWKRATAYVESDKWEQANSLWQKIYNSSNKPKIKAKAASNIAFYLELKSEFREAHDWALKASTLFKEHSGEGSDDYKRLSQYVAALLERIKDDKKLNMQLGNQIP
jgi:hypothetical protein